MLNEFIRMIVEGYSNSLIVCSRAGLGKTTAVYDALNQNNLVKGQHYNYYNNFATPVELFNILLETQQLETPKILVFDDTEMMLKDKKLVGILRSALWGANGKRSVNYLSSHQKIKTIDDFQGRMIFLLNQFDGSNPIMNALKSRGLYYEFDMTNDEVLDIGFKQIVSKPYKNLSEDDRTRVYQYLKTLGSDKNIKLSLRDFIRAFDCYSFSQSNWQALFRKLV
jgi:hypothetical protein